MNSENKKWAPFYLALLIGSIFAARHLEVGETLERQVKEQRLEAVYEQALSKCADTNRDGQVSQLEKVAFEEAVLSGKNVLFNDGDVPRYKNGKEVPVDTLINWIKNYSSTH